MGAAEGVGFHNKIAGFASGVGAAFGASGLLEC